MAFNKQKFISYYLPLILGAIVLIVAGVIYLNFRSPAPEAQAGWYNTGGTWSYRKPITIDHTKFSTAATSTFSSFPVLINVTDSDLISTGNGGKVASSTGADILFTDSNGTSLLNYEIESYASTTGNLVAWVKIPTLKAGQDYTIYEYFGNASAPAESAGNITGTWDSNYQGVWHLGNGTTLNLNDSTSNANNASVNSGAGRPVAGQIGGGQNFIGSLNDQDLVSDASSMQFTNNFTFEFWFKSNNTSQGNTYIIAKDNGGTQNSIIYGFVANQIEFFSLSYSGSDPRPGSQLNIADTSWHHVVYSYNGTTWSGYLDGLPVFSVARSFSLPTVAGTAWSFGSSRSSGDWVTAILDEIRFSNVARSSDWIKTEYNNQSSPSTFYAYGALGIQNRSSATAGVAVASRSGGISWYSNSWSYRKPITIDHNKFSSTATTTFSSFPVLVSVTDSDLKSTGNGGKVASSTGADILFTDSNGTNLLNYEIESYASTTGNLIAWVKIPTLTAGSDYTIYEYFGNASAPANTAANRQGTWDSNYQGVWHLPNGTVLTANDSTSNGNNASALNGTSATAGQVGGAASFNGTSNYIQIPNSASLQITSNMTISVWFNATSWNSVNEIELFKKDGNYVLRQNSSGDNGCPDSLAFDWWDGSNIKCVGTADPSSGVWHNLIATVSSNAISGLYLDGSLVSATVNFFGSASRVLTNAEALGGQAGGGEYLTGSIDETRISNSVRSADWIATEYKNQSSPATFYAYGALGINGRQTSSSVPAPAVKIRGGGSTGTSPLATDNFNRANADPLSGSWTSTGDAQHMILSSDAAIANSLSNDAGAFYNAITWPNDQYSQDTITTGTSGGGAGTGVIVRADSSKDYYRVVADRAGSNNVELMKKIGGTPTILWDRTATVHDGDTIRLLVLGNILRVYINGVQVGADTNDSSITSGSPGIAYSSTDSVGKANNWQGGSVVAEVPQVKFH